MFVLQSIMILIAVIISLRLCSLDNSAKSHAL